MQHYTEKDKMLTIHADRLIKSWTLKKSISADDARSVYDYILNKCPCYDVEGREIPGLYHPAQAWIVRKDVSECNGRKLPYTVKAGSVVLRRGAFCVTFGPDKTDAINAILTAREIVKKAAKKGGASA